MKISTKIKTATVSAMATVLATMSPVLADPGSSDSNNSGINGDILSKITNAKNLVYAVIAAVGGLVVAFSMIKIYQGTKNGDDNKTDQGITGVIVGILMAGIGGVMTFLGFN